MPWSALPVNLKYSAPLVCRRERTATVYASGMSFAMRPPYYPSSFTQLSDEPGCAGLD